MRLCLLHLFLQVWGRAKVATNILAANVEAEAGNELGANVKTASTFTPTKRVEREVQFDFHSDPPFYVYQVQSTVQMDAGVLVLWGHGYFMSHRPLLAHEQQLA